MHKHTQNPTRRNFLKFLGRAGLVTAGITFIGIPTDSLSFSATHQLNLPFNPILPSSEDKLLLAEGFEYYVLVKEGWKMNAQTTFGSNNDFLAFIPFDKNRQNEGLLWVNHEYVNPLFVQGFTNFENRDKEQIRREMQEVGGSILHVRYEESEKKWKTLQNEQYNRRLDALTEIPFAWHEPIAQSKVAIGTLANCAGGVTPWNTVLTCEENYDIFYGERNLETQERIPSTLGWEKYFDFPPEHYGWVVEIDVFSGEAKKLVALGRCAHECATVIQTPNHCVVYTGDDTVNECLYKFISKTPDSLDEGTLYVADIENGIWISLNYEEQPILQQNFKNQTEVLIRLRQAAKLVGGTPLDRPEDIEIDPITGAVIISLTENAKKGNYFGSLLKIVENNQDYTSLSFKAETMLTGGETTGFACPDNLAFDKNGNLWFTSDISGSKMHAPPYNVFKNNGLFFVPMQGENAGKVLQVASAPTDAEFTGPRFAPDGKTLFLCVQHPGETSQGLASEALSSNFPSGEKGALPRSVVVAICGETLEKLVK